mmetsp:Transcript_6647/g.11602  ORF Transcript_6647/g.11602 Transcript_6647/m.11602 type:complete len:232 (+) Transcript_6647:1070-1765(+)
MYFHAKKPVAATCKIDEAVYAKDFQVTLLKQSLGMAFITSLLFGHFFDNFKALPCMPPRSMASSSSSLRPGVWLRTSSVQPRSSGESTFLKPMLVLTGAWRLAVLEKSLWRRNQLRTLPPAGRAMEEPLRRDTAPAPRAVAAARAAAESGAAKADPGTSVCIETSAVWPMNTAGGAAWSCVSTNGTRCEAGGVITADIACMDILVGSIQPAMCCPRCRVACYRKRKNSKKA